MSGRQKAHKARAHGILIIEQGIFCCYAGKILGTLFHRVDKCSCIESMRSRDFIICSFLFYMKGRTGFYCGS